MYLAHLRIKNNGECIKQLLRTHNRQVGQYASECLEEIGLSSCGMLAGILHDGKGTAKYQEYLSQSAAWDAFDRGYGNQPSFARPRRGTVNHTFAGCIYLLDRYHAADKPETTSLDIVTSEFIACAIASHHGLFDCLSIEKKNGFLHRCMETDRASIQYDSAKKAFEEEISSREEIDELFHSSRDELHAFLDRLRCLHPERELTGDEVFLMLSMAERMLTSALIYADRRDTAEFFDEKSGKYGDIQPDWERNIEDFERVYSQIPSSDKPINQIRARISNQCRDFSDKGDGCIYQLNVPTGGGKTLSSLRYALYHARQYHKKRIIYVIPLLTIIDQNARDIREHLPNEKILEHHSDVLVDDMSKDELSQYDLMKNRWTAPVIISTLVQVLDILFSGKTQCVARMRALSDAILIFDEVQSVPYKTINLFNAAINYLAKFCRSTIILCSATQPTFEHVSMVPLLLSDENMVQLSAAEMKVFRRHQYHAWDGRDATVDDICHFALSVIEKENPLMIVCNTKSEAARIYQMLATQQDERLHIMHLSAGMCKAHRKIVLKRIGAMLEEIQNRESEDRLILVTTQIVEAGVNLSFRSVIRLMAGDDNLVQAAGRCNRSDEYHDHGDVYLMKLQNENLSKLSEIESARNAMISAIESTGDESFDPASQAFIRTYYRRLFRSLDDKHETLYPIQYRDGDTYHIAYLLANHIQPMEGEPKFFMHQPFKTAGEYFHVFDENTYSVLVPYHSEGEKLIRQIEGALAVNESIPPTYLQRAGEYTITIYEWQKRILEDNQLLIPIQASCRHEMGKRSSSAVLMYKLDACAYQEDIGLTMEPVKRTVDDYIF